MNSASSKDSQSPWAPDAIAKELTESMIVHVNVGQETIVITEDKVRLCLLKYAERLDERKAWITPASVAVTIFLTLVTTSFRDFGLDASTWRACFIIALVLTVAWLVRAFLSLPSTPCIEDILNEMKEKGRVHQLSSTEARVREF